MILFTNKRILLCKNNHALFYLSYKLDFPQYYRQIYLLLLSFDARSFKISMKIFKLCM